MKRLSRVICLFVIGLGLGPMLTGCETMVEGFSNVSGALFMMSPEQEMQFGQEVAKQIEADLTFVQDPEINRYITRIGNVIVRNSPPMAVPPSFYVVHDPAVNAFAIPGGNVYVQTGLINAADDEAELASVIAHEIGHVMGRHGAEQVSNQKGAAWIQSMILGDEAGQATQLVAGIITSGMMFKYSRDDEREADETAVIALHRSGYDPMALRTFFQKLSGANGGSGANFLQSMLSTHPPTTERMSNVEYMIRQLPPANYARPVDPLRKAQARLMQLGYASQ